MNRKMEDNGLKPMKLRHLLVLLLFLPVLVSAETIGSSDLVERNGLMYKKFTNTPFTGRTSGRLQTNYKDGKRHGPFEWYYKNGQLRGEETYKDGKLSGPSESYHKNGQLLGKSTYKDGKFHGSTEWYYENGQLKDKWTYKDGKKHGPFESYYENGQLQRKGTHKDGKLVGKTCFTETGKTTPCE